jgi:RNA polymerase sigma-70 factor (ECF subfamily)
VLDVAVGTVKSRCARGRARLLPRLTHLRPNAPEEGDTPPPEAGRNRTQGTSVPEARDTTGPPGTVKGGGQP